MPRYRVAVQGRLHEVEIRLMCGQRPPLPVESAQQNAGWMIPDYTGALRSACGIDGDGSQTTRARLGRVLFTQGNAERVVRSA